MEGRYLKMYRRRWCLTQGDLARLLGWKAASTVSRYETGKRVPTLEFAFAYFTIFGTLPADLFPQTLKKVEEEVIVRVRDLYDELQGNSSQRNRAKLDILENAIERKAKRDDAEV